MRDRNTAIKTGLTTIVSILVIIIALPDSWKTWAPDIIRRPHIHLGLDLAGGTQLDFRISEDEMMEQLANIDAEIERLQNQGNAATEVQNLTVQRQALVDQQGNIIEAIRNVLERRINSLGVSETTITPSYVGNEKHLLVECPGVVDVQDCIATVGKTIQLEFKEEFDEESATGYEETVIARVDNAEEQLENGASLQQVGQDLGDELGIQYIEERPYFEDQLPEGLESLLKRTTNSTVLRKKGSVSVGVTDENGQPQVRDIPGIFLAEVSKDATKEERSVNRADTAFPILTKEEPDLRHSTNDEVEIDDSIPAPLANALRSMQPGDLKSIGLDNNIASVIFLRSKTNGREEVEASHILISYAGAAQASADVTRTKEEALLKAQELKQQLENSGESFAALARKESDGPSSSNGGSLGVFGRGTMVPSFEEAAFSLPEGTVSDPIETNFGYHLIHVDSAPVRTPDIVSYEELIVPGPDAEARGNGLIGRLQAGQVKEAEDSIHARILFFSLEPTGWKDTPLDGKHFSSAAVTVDPTSNLPIVQILFDPEGGKMFQELTRDNVGKSIAIFVGGTLVSAPIVQQEISGGSAVITGIGNFDDARRLALDLNTGAIPAPIHLVGQRTVEATLGAEALNTSVMAGILGIIIVMLYMLLMYRFLGVLANVSLFIYAVIFLALLKLPLFLISGQYIVLTLAGAAGMILSIGMAVDTNVLIFERIREELKAKKDLKQAISIGFKKAWPSIRDSNVSTIITCIILFLIGTSLVRGFAVTLGTGVIISMFTGIVITKWLANRIADMPIGKKIGLFV